MMLLALALAAMPAAAETLPATEAEDARCLAAISYLIGVGSAEDQQKLTPLAIYFAGKLYGRNPTIDLTATLKNNLSSATEAELRAAVPRCAADLGRAGQAMQNAGAALSAMAKGAK